MIIDLRKFVAMLKGKGFDHAAAQRIARKAFASLTLEERAAIGLAFDAEESMYAGMLVEMLRIEATKSLASLVRRSVLAAGRAP
jgi:hypothetical protein